MDKKHTTTVVRKLIRAAIRGGVKSLISEHPTMLVRDCKPSLEKRVLGSLLTPSSLREILKAIKKDETLPLDS